MNSNDLAKQLHNRVTRGELLSTEEQTLLANWYDLQDNAESDAFGLTEDNTSLIALQTQVEIALTQLTVATKRIQETASENEALKREIARLRQQLVYQPTAQLL